MKSKNLRKNLQRNQKNQPKSSKKNHKKKVQKAVERPVKKARSNQKSLLKSRQKNQKNSQKAVENLVKKPQLLNNQKQVQLKHPKLKKLIQKAKNQEAKLQIQPQVVLEVQVEAEKLEERLLLVKKEILLMNYFICFFLTRKSDSDAS